MLKPQEVLFSLEEMIVGDHSERSGEVVTSAPATQPAQA